LKTVHRAGGGKWLHASDLVRQVEQAIDIAEWLRTRLCAGGRFCVCEFVLQGRTATSTADYLVASKPVFSSILGRQGGVVAAAVWGEADYARFDAGFAIGIVLMASDWRNFWAEVVARGCRRSVLGCCADLAICAHVRVLASSRRRVGGHLIVDWV
jgi:hypothetical protein